MNLLRLFRGGPGAAGAEPVGPSSRLMGISDLPAVRERALLEQEIAAVQQKNQLRKLYAWGMFGVVTVQLGVVNGVFIAYLAGAGRPAGTAIDATAMEFYLGATFVQVIGIVLVITKNLFPEGPAP